MNVKGNKKADDLVKQELQRPGPAIGVAPTVAKQHIQFWTICSIIETIVLIWDRKIFHLIVREPRNCSNLIVCQGM